MPGGSQQAANFAAYLMQNLLYTWEDKGRYNTELVKLFHCLQYFKYLVIAF